jgi:hypothetical protein
MKDLYLTSTFTNPWNVAFNDRIGAALEKEGFACYLPYRDTDQKAPGKVKFESDVAGIQNARIILCVAMNESPNFGAEVGYGHGIGKLVIALTDKTHSIPLICGEMMSDIVRVENLDAIDDYIGELAAKIREFLK